VIDIAIEAFLSGPRNPEHEVLLRLLDGDDARTERDTGSEWSDAELSELDDLLMCEISIKEIARLLGRDHDDVRDKVAEVVGPAARTVARTRAAQLFWVSY
jgi:hypothetical protein